MWCEAIFNKFAQREEGQKYSLKCEAIQILSLIKDPGCFVV